MSKVFIRLIENKTGLESSEISIEDLIYNQKCIKFHFWNETKTNIHTISYKDFLNNVNKYKVIVRILGGN